MSNSNEIPEIEELPELDYSEIPEDLKQALTQKKYSIEKKVKLTYDGSQYIARIPSEIAEELELGRESRMKFRFKKPLQKEDRKPTGEDVEREMKP